MTDRELLQEILATYLVFGELPTQYTNKSDIVYTYILKIYLLKSVRSNEELGWKWIDSDLRYNERSEFFTLLRIAHIKE